MNIKQLKEVAQGLFSERTQYMTLLQEIAENFYPQRADFTVTRQLGDEFADNLSTSYPMMARRDLGDQIGVMLRPVEKKWFKMAPEDEEREDLEAKQWLEWAANIQRRAMYDPASKFNRATKEADHDFAAFGQAVISINLNRQRDKLLYRCWHLRDVAWKENEEGDVGFIVRKWKPTYEELQRTFPGRCHENIEIKARSKPFEKINCFHFICEAKMFDENTNKPYFSIYYDIENDHILEKVGVYNSEYLIPRWQTVAGSQYAYSPAAICALPDARLIQAMTYTLLEAGEKAVNPPLVATQDAIRSDISIFAGGVTWVSEEYDERLGAAVRPISQDTRSIPLGIDMSQNVQAAIHQAFYLNKLNLPERNPEMTAYEVSQRIQEYIRGALPIFEPMEAEYNGALCEKTFEVLMRAGAFGSMLDLPATLQGADVRFKFESPLHDAIEQQKGQKFIESQALLAEAAALDQTAPMLMDAKTALRDVLLGIGTPPKWIRDEAEVEAMERAQQQQAEAANMLDAMQQSSEIAEKVSNVEGIGV